MDCMEAFYDIYNCNALQECCTPGTGGYSISLLSLAFRDTSVSPVNLHIIDNCSRQVSDL